MLDRQRAAYFTRSRALDQTKGLPEVAVELHKDQRFYFDQNWRSVANLNQLKYNQIVLHPFLAKYKSHVADLRWIQVLYEYTVPENAIAVKSFLLQIESYRTHISLNIKKPQYQTSYVISNEFDTGENFNDFYFEKYKEHEMTQENLPAPDGFRDVISSVESGDTISILMSRTQKSIKQDLSSYVKNFRVNITLVEKQESAGDVAKRGVAKKEKEKPKEA